MCFSNLSTSFNSPAKVDSYLRKTQRFFSEHSISQNIVAKFIFQQLPRKEKYHLAIDRTNWQFGKTDINIFMLAVIHDGKPELQEDVTTSAFPFSEYYRLKKTIFTPA